MVMALKFPESSGLCFSSRPVDIMLNSGNSAPDDDNCAVFVHWGGPNMTKNPGKHTKLFKSLKCFELKAICELPVLFVSMRQVEHIRHFNHLVASYIRNMYIL